jgi:hypothetical protein
MIIAKTTLTINRAFLLYFNLAEVVDD